MIGQVVVLVAAVAVSTAAALPFPNCAPWDSASLGNIIPGQVVGANFPVPQPQLQIFDAPSVGNFLPQQTAAPAALPHFAQAVPLIQHHHVQRIQTHVPNVQIPNVQLPSVQIPNVQVPTFQPAQQIIHQNVEARLPAARLPTFEARLPTFEARLPTFEARLPAFEARGVPTAIQTRLPTFDAASIQNFQQFPCGQNVFA